MTEGVSYLKYSKPSSYQTGNGEPSLYRANDQAEDELPNLIVFDDGNDYVECVDVFSISCFRNQSTVQLKNHMIKCLESVANDNDRNYNLLRLHPLLATAQDRLTYDQLENILRIMGTDKISYGTHRMTTSMELELHLRVYMLALEATAKRHFVITRKFHETLYEQLSKFYDVHQRHTKVLKNGLNRNFNFEYSPYNEQRAYDLHSRLKKGISCQNYNIDFLLIHLRDTLHAMHDDETVLFKIIKSLKVVFTSLVEILPGVTNIMADIQTPFDDNTSLETYNKIQQDLGSKFPINYWYKDWRYLYSTYQAFVEWSEIPINKDLVFKGELMIIKDLWRFGDQEWAKAAVKSESDMDTFKSTLKHSLIHIGGYAPVSYPYSLLYGILEITEKLILSTKNASTLAHCYYLAKLTLDIVLTENIQFKAVEVLMTLHKKKPDTFSVVQADLCQHIERLAVLDKANINGLQDMIEFFNMKYKFTNTNASALVLSTSKQKAVLEQNPEELLDFDSDDLLILDMVADHLTCPFTQKVTDDFRVLPCGHKISHSALETFMKLNYDALKCFYCNKEIQIQDTKVIPCSPIYKALYKRFVETGYIMPIDNTMNFTKAVENQDNSDAEESSIRKSKFLYLLKMKPKKTLMQKIRRPKRQHPTYRQGKKALNKERYKDAILWLKRALEHYPNSSTILYNLAMAYMKSTDYQECYNYITKCISNNPKNPRAWALRGNNYMLQSEYRKSLNDLKQSLELKPNDAFTLRIRGTVYCKLHLYDKALNDFSQSLEAKPNDAFTLRARGTVYSTIDQYNNALNDFNKSLKIKPSDPDTLNARGGVYYKLAQHDKALNDFSRLLMIKPNDADTLRAKGNVHLALNQNNDALTDLNKSLEIKPNDAITLSIRGAVYLNLEQYNNSLVDLSKSLEMSQNDADTLSVRGTVYYKLAQYDNSLIDFNKSLEIKPNDASTLKGRGHVYFALKQYDNALTDFNKSLEIKPNDAVTLSIRGIVYLNLKQYDNALIDLTKSLEINPINADALRARGTIYHELAQYENALNDLSNLLEIEPNNAYTLRARGGVYLEFNLHDSALMDFSKALKIKPYDAVTLCLRGTVYLNLKQYDNALVDLNGSLEISSNNADAWRARGTVYYKLAQYENALNDFNKSLKIKPNDASTLRGRGNTYLALSQYYDALIDFNKSLEMKPNDVQTLRARGAVFMKLQQHNNALNDINKLLEINKNDAFI